MHVEVIATLGPRQRCLHCWLAQQCRFLRNACRSYELEASSCRNVQAGEGKSTANELAVVPNVRQAQPDLLRAYKIHQPAVEV
jgi:hypothetical protein